MVIIGPGAETIMPANDDPFDLGRLVAPFWIIPCSASGCANARDSSSRRAARSLEIFGAPDDLKFAPAWPCSRRSRQETIFAEAPTLCCDGEADRATVAWLSERRDA
jgi:uncharacterized protein (DUF1810 family)